MAVLKNEPVKINQEVKEQALETAEAPHGGHAKSADESQQEGPVLDYAGSAEKTDPEEIRLVRKLDLMMLASARPTPSGVHRLGSRTLTPDSPCSGSSIS